MPDFGGGRAKPDTEAPADQTTQDGEADQTNEADPNADA